jgi:hypothetical protein
LNRQLPKGAVPQHYFKEVVYKLYLAAWLEEAKPQPEEVIPGEATRTTRVAEAGEAVAATPGLGPLKLVLTRNLKETSLI